MEDHKIQSSSGLQLHLSQVPKMLRTLTLEWALKSYVISFKLETNENILFDKSWKAICNYRVNLVVANVLSTRTNVCYLIYDNNLICSKFNNNNNNSNKDSVIDENQFQIIENRSIEIINKKHAIIESTLVSKVIEKHLDFYYKSIQHLNKNKNNTNDDLIEINYNTSDTMYLLNALNNANSSSSSSSSSLSINHTEELVKTINDSVLLCCRQYIDIINTGDM